MIEGGGGGFSNRMSVPLWWVEGHETYLWFVYMYKLECIRYDQPAYFCVHVHMRLGAYSVNKLC